MSYRDIKLLKKLGGTVDDTELIEGLVLDQKTSGYEGPKKIEKAKIKDREYTKYQGRKKYFIRY